MSSNKPIQIAIVGLGRAGWHLHFQPALADSRFQICAVSDPEPARIEEAGELSGCRGYLSIENLLAEETPDIVVVATPNGLHASHAGAVLRAGCHCVVEKPLAGSFAEAEAIAAQAQLENKHLFVHHQHVFRDEYNHFCEIRDSGILGEIFHVRCFWGSYHRRWDWQTLRKNGGGQLNNTCPHALSIVLPILGEPVADVHCRRRNVKDAGDCEDHVQMFLETGNGVTADVTISSACAVPGMKWMILGRHGSLQSDGKTSQLRYFDPSGVPPLTVVDGAAPERKYLTEELPWVEETRPTRPGQSAESFYDNVAGVLRDDRPMRATTHSALEVSRILDLAERSARAANPATSSELFGAT